MPQKNPNVKERFPTQVKKLNRAFKLYARVCPWMDEKWVFTSVLNVNFEANNIRSITKLSFQADIPSRH